MPRPLRIVIAPDSFKGSLTAAQAAAAMAVGARRARPDVEVVLMPLADGGEGTEEALVVATGGWRHSARVMGPLGDLVDAVWGRLGPGGETAVVEMAAAAGLPLVPPDKRDPRRTTTFGVGELLRRPVEAGAKRLIIGLGGSATNDGGVGAMQALGVRFWDAAGVPLPEPITGGDLRHLARIDASALHALFAGVEVVIASDVTNPLLGPTGASAVYGPQKGADAAIVAELDAALTQYAAVLRRDLGRDVAALPGAGAAGGMGAGLMAFLGARMQSGIDLVLDAARFEERAQGADWLLTGEGRIDAQTLSGKTLSGVLRRCRPLDIPAIAFGGSVDDAVGEQLAAEGLRAAFPIVSGPTSLEDAMRDAGALLTQAVARVVRLL